MPWPRAWQWRGRQWRARWERERPLRRQRWRILPQCGSSAGVANGCARSQQRPERQSTFSRETRARRVHCRAAQRMPLNGLARRADRALYLRVQSQAKARVAMAAASDNPGGTRNKEFALCALRIVLGVRAISKDGEAGIAHGRDGGTAVERSGRSQPQTPMGQ